MLIENTKGSNELLAIIVISMVFVVIFLVTIQYRLKGEIDTKLFLFSLSSFLLVIVFSVLSTAFFAPISNLASNSPIEISDKNSITITPESSEIIEDYLIINNLPVTPENKTEVVEKAVNLLVESGSQGSDQPNPPQQIDPISGYSLSIESLTCEPRLPSYSSPVTIKKELLNPKHFIQADKNGIGLSCQIPNDSTSNFSQLALELALEDRYQNTVDVNVYVDGEKTGFTTLNAGEGSKTTNIDIKDASTFRIELKQIYGNYIVANVYFLKAELT